MRNRHVVAAIQELGERVAALEPAGEELALGLVRLHQRKERASFEGLLLGVMAGHYRLAKAKLLVDANREHDIDLDGEVYVACADVVYLQKVG